MTTRSSLALAVALVVAMAVGVLAMTSASAPSPRENASARSSTSAPASAPASPPASASASVSGSVPKAPVPCTFSRRGVPSQGCRPLVGATYESNTDPSSWESELGRRLGVRRTYWGPDEVRKAVRTARDDVRARRIPWISFKLPYDWSDMASGTGDAWTRDLATRLSRLHGPVWVAFHHEPEGDGDVAEWKAMQERLAPIVRAAAPNVAYTVILTGLHQVNGDPRYGFDSIWPDTTVDVAGFDPYNWYGTETSEGTPDTNAVDMKGVYFDPISRWAQSKRVAWAVAETGYTDAAHAVDPTWLSRTFAGLEADHGIALAYFNTPLNSERSWTWVLGSPSKQAAFADVLSRSGRPR